MRRLRRFALAAFVLDALLGVGALLVTGKATEASAAPTETVLYEATASGCVAYYRVAEGAWRYGGLTDEAACAEAGR